VSFIEVWVSVMERFGCPLQRGLGVIYREVWVSVIERFGCPL
jgi:hypothetical protein